jgi:hypothetical protein
VLYPQARFGLAGQMLHLVEPHSEAAPAALLLQALAAFGNCIGRHAHFRIEGDTHYLNLYGAVVGDTSKARKGTSWGRPRQLFQLIDPVWTETRIQGGLVSGEGVIYHLRDATPAAKEEDADPGVTDKRLLSYEAEFASVLKMSDRQGNTLSTQLRDAWDRGNIQTLAKNNPIKATGAHLSIIAHITADELRRYLSATEQANGFANRFLWVYARRSKLLPQGGGLPDQPLVQLAASWQQALEVGRTCGEMGFTPDASDLWAEIYEQLSEGLPGPVGAMTARAEAQIRRLAWLYALLDDDGSKTVVDYQHLEAARTLWRYAEQSVKFIFGESLGDQVADDIPFALKEAPEGLTRKQINDDVFKRNKGASVIGRALKLLEVSSLAWCKTTYSGPRKLDHPVSY